LKLSQLPQEWLSGQDHPTGLSDCSADGRNSAPTGLGDCSADEGNCPL